MYGVGVIGCGGMGTAHAGHFAALPDVEVVACADAVAEAAQRLAVRHNARAYTDAQQLLEDPRVNVVVICTPTQLHAGFAVLRKFRPVTGNRRIKIDTAAISQYQ